MKFTIEYPIAKVGYDPALVRPDGMTAVARAAEELGYAALAISDHPAPAQKWIDAGGHESLDQAAALGFCAAVTSSLRLMTYSMVLPYRHPLQAAKALSTVDLLSNGRVDVVAGTGYLRSEFLALGAEIEERNDVFDEALRVMRSAWTGEPVHHQGDHFSARGAASLPAPHQAGGPPVLIAGNSARARERAAAHQGWSPLLISAEAARHSRTAGIGSIDELAQRIDEVRTAARTLQGDAVRIRVQVHSTQAGFIQAPGSWEEHRDHLGLLAQAGVDAFVIRPPGAELAVTLDALAQYASEVVRGS